ncbi:MAG TPA: Glu/Leu/Phe/Val dehydrogenase dimerization domain-containing protein [Solirubrobacteraceae bacterium]|nr:Glu/Leu/Phe/Val dehydrogenase dimerization domain-containing protein [Solirubrobacteraceae bacterium]
MVAVHSTARGPSLGGCRMWHYEDNRAAQRDVLRLSRAMTYKAAVANLPLGGGKGVIALPQPEPPAGARRRDVLLDFADTVDALKGAYITAEDVGTSARDMTVIARATKHVSGLARSRGGSGDPSPSTALGVAAAIEAACERALGSASVKGRSVAVVGLGHVGLRLAALLARRGAELLVADIDGAKRAEAARIGARWTTPESAMTAEVDVLAPCALGGVLHDGSVPALQCPVVAGAANNQLADETVAEQLAGRGILWAPDFVANAGGIINISVELERGGYDPGRARERVQGIGDTIREIFDAASADRVTPLAAAMRLAAKRVAEGAGAGRR